MKTENIQIAIVGLGYVGLPLAVEFAKKFQVIGFDIDSERISELKVGFDRTLEVSQEELADVRLSLTYDENDLVDANCYVVTVPTPIDANNNPDLQPLLRACVLVGNTLKAGDIVIFESTVYPGATEERCVPVLEDASGLTFNFDFTCGYSPERVNPGDKTRRLSEIVKVTSGSSSEAADFVDFLYKQIIEAGTHRAESIKVAEAAKVIENTQRDLNIALINELSMIFHKLDIDTDSVLRAAGTKWNFLHFRPGLVGGHCIGVDPYYLTHKAEAIGFHPQVILAGRRVNDAMGQYVASQVVKALVSRSIELTRARVLVLGLAFKEECPDIRNSKVVDLISELREYQCEVDVFDPWIRPDDASKYYNLTLLDSVNAEIYDAIIIAVAHSCFLDLWQRQIVTEKSESCVVFDLKCILPRSHSDFRL